MCSDPQKNLTKDGVEHTFACRNCNDCIATRRKHWVARAMMEKQTGGNCLSFAFTYDDKTPHNRAAARVFCYADVRAFLHRLRAAVRRIDPSDRVRFLIAGEQGSRKNRCHWHALIYSKTDLLTVGEFSRILDGRKQVVTDREMILSDNRGRNEVRLDWPLWGHGFVTIQEPDEGGVAYVLSYALKDQFTTEKSLRTMRVTKSEPFATGLFRMSKTPSIGETWLFQKLSRLDAENAVLPSLSFTIPDMSGFYHPSGRFRRLILESLEAICWRVRVQHGFNPPQLGALLASLEDQPHELEIFNVQEKIDEFDHLTEYGLAARGRQQADVAERQSIRRRCGRSIPCRSCLDVFEGDKLASLELDRQTRFRGVDFYGEEIWVNVYTSVNGETFDQRSKRYDQGCNSHCQLRGSKAVRLAFPKTGGWD